MYTLKEKISLPCQIEANVFGSFGSKCEGESMRNSLLVVRQVFHVE